MRKDSFKIKRYLRIIKNEEYLQKPDTWELLGNLRNITGLP